MRAVLFLAGVLGVVPALQGALILGSPSSGGNVFPFTGEGGSRYQQVYNASAFGGPLTITGLTFYASDGTATTSDRTFTVYLSTTSVAVDALSSNMDSNLGADNVLFAVYDGGEAVTGSFTIYGTPFAYNPVAGNLLMDILVGSGLRGSGSFQSRTADASGIFSRRHDFGSGFEGFGLVTGFESGVVIPEPATIALIGSGLGLLAWRSRRKR